MFVGPSHAIAPVEVAIRTPLEDEPWFLRDPAATVPPPLRDLPIPVRSRVAYPFVGLVTEAYEQVLSILAQRMNNRSFAGITFLKSFSLGIIFPCISAHIVMAPLYMPFYNVNAARNAFTANGQMFDDVEVDFRATMAMFLFGSSGDSRDRLKIPYGRQFQRGVPQRSADAGTSTQKKGSASSMNAQNARRLGRKRKFSSSELRQVKRVKREPEAYHQAVVQNEDIAESEDYFSQSRREMCSSVSNPPPDCQDVGSLAVTIRYGPGNPPDVVSCLVWGVRYVADEDLQRSRVVQRLARRPAHPARPVACGALLQACRKALYRTIECLTIAGQAASTELGLAIANEYFHRLYRHDDGVISVEVARKGAGTLNAPSAPFEPLDFAAFEHAVDQWGLPPNRLINRKTDKVDAKGSSRFSAHIYTALQQVGTGQFFNKGATVPSCWPHKPRAAPTRRSSRAKRADEATDIDEDEPIALGAEWSGEDQAMATSRRLRNAGIRIRLVSSEWMDRLIREGVSRGDPTCGGIDFSGRG